MNKHQHDNSKHPHHHHMENKRSDKAMHGENNHDMSNHRHMGHNHHEMMIDDFKKRFWVCLILSVPVILFSPMVQEILGYHLSFPGIQYLAFLLSSAVFFYGGWPFLKGLLEEVKQRNPGMMTLIGVAISVAYIYSSAIVFGLKGMDFFWELVTLIDIMLLGHWIEMKSVLGASKALELLVSMMPSEAHLIHGDHIMDVKVDALKVNDIILVKPGEKVPADGTVIEGESYLNESMLTGESSPVKKVIEDQLIGGSVNGNGSLKVKVLHTGKDSYLTKVINLVNEAQKAKSTTQNLADKAAKWLTFIAIGVGVVTFIIWLIIGKDLEFALERMVTVMVISCPHALGLAVPLVVAISTAISAKNGLLIRNRTAFENSRKITAMVFDKTGTLTQGEFGVTRYESASNEFSREDILMFAGAIEQNSEHPIATGILAKVKKLNFQLPKTANFQAISGKGIEASVAGRNTKVVSPGFLIENDISIPENAFNSSSETVVFLLIDEKLAGFIALADEIRPESKEAIETFRRNGIKVMMATGDNTTVAEAVSKQLGLEGFYAEVLPHQKVEIIKELQRRKEYVAMTGDGINDAPALAQADVGIAVGSGTDIAAETADIILVNSNPKDIANLILFGKATYSKMIQNLIWATAYNALAIPLAAGVLYTTGFVLSPAVGAVLMSLSTIVVAINAQFLKGSLKK
ncbi:copper-translocating P-type ATPase [Sporocytophaga myxococcoides]|nr:copper-translocating P-type ATPase [Sporocytophaga myxococcoides]